MLDLVLAFDPFTLLAPLISGGLNLAGSAFQNQQNESMQMENQFFNSMQAQLGRDFSAQQTGITRDFAGAEADKARNFNAGEADKARSFNAEQAQLGRQYDYTMTQSAKDYNTKEQQANRDFQERMSSSAYQRATQDMKAAGINPMVAYQQGGAAQPGGGSASIGMSHGPTASGPAASGPAASGSVGSAPTASSSLGVTMQNLAQGALSSAMEYAKGHPMIENLKQDFKTKQEETDAVAALKRERIISGDLMDDTRDRVKAETKLKQYEADKAKSDSEFYGSKWGNIARNVGNIGREAGPLLNSAQGLSDIIRGR